ncbi:WXG100 family type VII secretion target [Kibdelosporangium persicum]
MVSSFTVSVWPDGQAAGAPDSLIGRLTSNVSAQSRHLNS